MKNKIITDTHIKKKLYCVSAASFLVTVTYDVTLDHVHLPKHQDTDKRIATTIQIPNRFLIMTSKLHGENMNMRVFIHNFENKLCPSSNNWKNIIKK